MTALPWRLRTATGRHALLALACSAALAAPSARAATDLLQAWQAAEQHDRAYAVARAAHAVAQPRRDQAAALWRPNVALTAAAGVGTHDSDVRGAQFAAPGLGTSNGVDFSTSVRGGTATRWALQASQPLYHPQRRAQQQQLGVQADQAELQWQAAQQALLLRTAQRYVDVAVAQEALAVVALQLQAVQRAATEAQDRYDLGSAPITDTHEARARLAALRAQQLAAHSALELKRRLLADSTGLAGAALVVQWPGDIGSAAVAAATPAAPATATTATAAAAPLRALAAWQQDADAANPDIRLQALAVDSARAEVLKHRRAAAPTLDLVAQAGQERLHGSGDFGRARNTSLNAMVGVQLNVPLWSGGMRSAKEGEALALQVQAEAQLEAVREQVAQQVHAAHLALSVGAERVQALTEALAASQSRQGATRLGQEVGDRTLLDVLNAENDSAGARLALAQARSQLLLERLRLAQLAGQLNEDALRGAQQAAALALSPARALALAPEAGQDKQELDKETAAGTGTGTGTGTRTGTGPAAAKGP